MYHPLIIYILFKGAPSTELLKIDVRTKPLSVGLAQIVDIQIRYLGTPNEVSKWGYR